MRRLLFPLFIVVLIIILLFLGLPGLEKTFSDLITSSAQQTKKYFVGISFSLLALDVFLPIPSSIVMFFNGSVLGVLIGGLLSLISCLVSSVIGYFFGKAFYKKLNKNYTEEELNKSVHIVNNYGFVGLILTRGIPILSEAIAILCGNMAYSFRHFFMASFIGYVPVCFMYSFIGSHSMGQDGFLWAFGINVFIAAIFLAMNFIKPATTKTANQEMTINK